MDNKESENKAKPMKKRNVHLVHEHFEEVLMQLSGFVAFVQRSLFVGSVVNVGFST